MPGVSMRTLLPQPWEIKYVLPGMTYRHSRAGGNLVQHAKIVILRGQEPTTMKQPAVYILASKRNGTLYIGVTSDLVQRVWQHKNDVFPGFTKKYGVHMLVWYELHEDMENAIVQEKRLIDVRAANEPTASILLAKYGLPLGALGSLAAQRAIRIGTVPGS